MTARAGHAALRPDGTIILTSRELLRPYPESWNARLIQWGTTKPDHVFLTERGPRGDRRALTYGDALARVRAMAEAILGLGLDAESPLAILSENSIDCAIITLAALYAGVPASPISPSYALLAREYTRLAGVLDALGPGALFVADASRYADAIGAACPADLPVISAGALIDSRTIPFAELLNTQPGPRAKRAHEAVGRDTVAKIMFTSGSSGSPKPVILPHRMLAANRQQSVQVFAYLEDEPPVLVDWLPWHHTFGGNNNFGIALWCGGTLHIDDGKPNPAGIARTVELLKASPPTIYFNSPGGFDALIPHLRDDGDFRSKFFSRLKLMQYGGALLPPHLWEALDDLAVRETGTRILMVSGIGSTECGPTPMQSSWEQNRKPEAGLPVPGVEAKLVPVEDTWELRLRGPCITPGYWRRPDLTAQAFDEEGFFILGDAVRPVDPHDFARGLLFDGRLSDNFKLSSGTWVQAGSVRAALMSDLAPALRDAVVTGANRDYLGAIGFPDLPACRSISGLSAEAPPEAVLHSPALRSWLARRLSDAARKAGGSSQRVVRLILESEPPTLENGELTDKGAAAPRIVLRRRASVVEEIYSAPPSDRTIVVRDLV